MTIRFGIAVAKRLDTLFNFILISTHRIHWRK